MVWKQLRKASFRVLHLRPNITWLHSIIAVTLTAMQEIAWRNALILFHLELICLKHPVTKLWCGFNRSMCLNSYSCFFCKSRLEDLIFLLPHIHSLPTIQTMTCIHSHCNSVDIIRLQHRQIWYCKVKCYEIVWFCSLTQRKCTGNIILRCWHTKMSSSWSGDGYSSKSWDYFFF